MKKLRIWEKLCHLAGRISSSSHNHHTKRKISSVHYGFPFVVAASVLVLTATILFMFVSISSTPLNPILGDNVITSFYHKFSFPHWPFHTSNISSSIIIIVDNNNTLAMSNNFSSSSSSSRKMSCDHCDEKKHGNGDDLSNGAESDMFDGKWIKVENRKPYYSPGSCPFVKPEPYACYENGRPDAQFLRWQWQWSSKQPNANCSNIPRSSLDAKDFLERLRGKRLVFVGDSLNRNMYVSLVCIFWNVISDKRRVHRPLGNAPFESRGDLSLVFEDYNCTIVFVWSAYLVKETNSIARRSQNTSKPKLATLRLDLIDEVASSVYRNADIVVFGSWHWWVRGKTNNGINYFQQGNYLYPKMEIDEAYKKALTTWRRWIDKNTDPNKTQVVFRGHSLSHYVGGRWNTGGHCHLEKEPMMSNETYVHPSPSQAKILEDVLGRTKTPVMYLNISKLTYYRSDGHPSLYAKNYTSKERVAVIEDCSHWCLPGVADTWNELLYASLLKAGKGSFGRF